MTARRAAVPADWVEEGVRAAAAAATAEMAVARAAREGEVAGARRVAATGEAQRAVVPGAVAWEPCLAGTAARKERRPAGKAAVEARPA